MDAIRRITGAATFDDIARGFSGVNPEHPEYSWDARVTEAGEAIDIDGIVRCEGAEVGHFARRLFYEKKHVRAFHTILEIKEEHKLKRNAFYHYVNAFRLYAQMGIAHISMEAEFEGPRAWAQMGFDLSQRRHREMLLKIVREQNIEFPGGRAPDLLAPSVAALHRGDELVGLQAIAALLERAGEPLPMALDLHNHDQRVFLMESGIIPKDFLETSP